MIVELIHFVFQTPWVWIILLGVMAVQIFLGGPVDQTTPCASCDHPRVAHGGRSDPCVRCRCGGYVPRRW